MVPESILYCLVRCKNAIPVRQELAIATTKVLREFGVSPKNKVKVEFDNIEHVSNKIKRSEGWRTSREYLVGMMGIENGAIMDVVNDLVLAGFKRAIAEKKARGFVGRVKRNCIIALHKLYKASTQSET